MSFNLEGRLGAIIRDAMNIAITADKPNPATINTTAQLTSNPSGKFCPEGMKFSSKYVNLSLASGLKWCQLDNWYTV